MMLLTLRAFFSRHRLLEAVQVELRLASQGRAHYCSHYIYMAVALPTLAGLLLVFGDCVGTVPFTSATPLPSRVAPPIDPRLSLA